MANELQGQKIAFLVPKEDGMQDGLWEAVRNEWEQVRNAGGTPELLYAFSGKVENPDHLDEDYSNKRERNEVTFSKASATDYDGFVLPTRMVNPNFSQMDQDAASFTEKILRQDWLIASNSKTRNDVPGPTPDEEKSRKHDAPVPPPDK